VHLPPLTKGQSVNREIILNSFKEVRIKEVKIEQYLVKGLYSQLNAGKGLAEAN
jgi:hypothetical protein